MTEVYVIRHAEAEGNRYRRIHGQYNSVVTARGWQQIDALAKRFADIHIDVVYSSDLTRTRMTASSIYKTHGLPLNVTPRLREVCMGAWEDVPWGEVEQSDPEQLYCFNYDPENWTTPGREDIYVLR
ncbi:MAG: histidine phosphatase family protein, partial [Oscillospiraceae bacterium]|nr:histidine phosphatase family protein [Oscillospiraceae bacterium]